MRANKVKALWREGKPALAAWTSSGDPYIVEVMANTGFDALIIDMQHGMGITVDRAIACLQAISTTDTVPIVRVPWNDPLPIQLVLDAGAYGIIVPMVNNYKEAAKAAAASRYPPLGDRSTGPNRARLYAGPDYTLHANDEVIVLVMIETQEGVDNVEEIAKVPGIDGFYIGPSDLAVSMGIPPGPNASKDPRHAEACQRVLEAANAAGLVPCYHGGGTEDAIEEALRRLAQGFKMCQIARDVEMVTVGAAAALRAIRKATS